VIISQQTLPHRSNPLCKALLICRIASVVVNVWNFFQAFLDYKKPTGIIISSPFRAASLSYKQTTPPGLRLLVGVVSASVERMNPVGGEVSAGCAEGINPAHAPALRPWFGLGRVGVGRVVPVVAVGSVIVGSAAYRQPLWRFTDVI